MHHSLFLYLLLGCFFSSPAFAANPPKLEIYLLRALGGNFPSKELAEVIKPFPQNEVRMIEETLTGRPFVLHFHEWLGVTANYEQMVFDTIRRKNIQVRTDKVADILAAAKQVPPYRAQPITNALVSGWSQKIKDAPSIAKQIEAVYTAYYTIHPLTTRQVADLSQVSDAEKDALLDNTTLLFGELQNVYNLLTTEQTRVYFEKARALHPAGDVMSPPSENPFLIASRQRLAADLTPELSDLRDGMTNLLRLIHTLGTPKARSTMLRIAALADFAGAPYLYGAPMVGGAQTAMLYLNRQLEVLERRISDMAYLLTLTEGSWPEATTLIYTVRRGFDNNLELGRSLNGGEMRRDDHPWSVSGYSRFDTTFGLLALGTPEAAVRAQVIDRLVEFVLSQETRIDDLRTRWETQKRHEEGTQIQGIEVLDALIEGIASPEKVSGIRGLGFAQYVEACLDVMTRLFLEVRTREMKVFVVEQTIRLTQAVAKLSKRGELVPTAVVMAKSLELSLLASEELAHGLNKASGADGCETYLRTPTENQSGST